MNNVIGYDARNNAITSPENVIVTAGAGTGKTTILIDKLSRLITTDKMPIDQIVALTFTEKAANEMKIRLLQKLTELKSTSSGSTSALIDTTISKLAMAHIGTIHSFCAHILRTFPIEAGVSPNFTVDEGNVFDTLLESEWRYWLEREMILNSPNRERWLALLQSLKISEIEQFVRNACNFTTPLDKLKTDNPDISMLLDVTLPFVSNFRKKFIESGYVNFDGLLTITRDLLKSNTSVRRELKRAFRAILLDEAQDNDPIQVEIILYLSERENNNAINPRDIKPKRGKLFIVGDSKQSIYSFRGADIEAFELMRTIVKENGGEEYNLQTNFRSHSGIVDTTNALFSRIIEKNELLQPEYTPIYANRKKREDIKSQKVELWYAVANKDKGNNALSVTVGADEAREIEADAIAKFITTSVGKLLIMAEGNIIRPLEYKDIALLFRKRTTSNAYLDAIKLSGIPYITQDEHTFYRTQEIIDMFNILKAIEDPNDRIALVGVLRSPLASASDRDIYELHKLECLDYRKDIPSSFNTNNNVAKIYPTLRNLHNLAGEFTPYQLINKILEETFLLELSALSYYGEQAVSNILKMRSIAIELSNKPDITLKSLIDLMNRRIKDIEKEGESPLADETINAVKILSIHKAKGLEFPVVIIPDLHGSQNASPEKVEIKYNWLKDKVGIKIGDIENTDYDYVNNHVKDKLSAEEKRILYVAMTRAREMLILTGSGDARGKSNFIATIRNAVIANNDKAHQEKKDKATNIRNIGTGDYKKCGIDIRYITKEHHKMPIIAPHIKDDITVGTKKINYKDLRAKWRKRQERYDYISSIPRFVSPTELIKQSHLQQHTHQEHNTEGVVIGVICHRTMELWDFDVATISKYIEIAIKESTAVLGEKVEHIKTKVNGIFSAFVNSDIYKEIKSAKVLAREAPFVMKSFQLANNNTAVEQIIDGRMDLLYEYEGETIVADYKTDTIRTKKDVDEKVKFYKEQYESYREAVKRSMGIENPVVKLIFLQVISPQGKLQAKSVTI
ncbi:MAG: hypothetical protein A2W05_04840 [Candidatus Schekmanbacteria bacterium RBG_16_38_10]|uniref:DNA 3'-5' helicase n=1 Tax=Candidatus Schekmanbacteria bacterium RBG_16_38_10 TaxID=1817879 RepID=A0A1F7RVC2_9BACT|nr:MAG: hypothetical protein A2W05_04840 [Candidatus Schekmanbacteria bacterium RBG_16_38_10]